MEDKYAELRAAVGDDPDTDYDFECFVQYRHLRALLAERDVLREALTELCDEIDKHEIHAAISKTSISWFKRKARAALAQGEV